MPIECTKSNLVDLAKCFCGLDPAQRGQIELYLLCQIANAEGGGTTVQAGIEAIALNASTGSVTFPSAFASAPVVVCTVVDSSDTQILSSSPVAITAAGFTFNLTSAAETANCSLHWHATLAT